MPERSRFRTRRFASAEGATALLRPRNEATRERDVFRQLHSWTNTHKPTTLDRPAFPHDVTQPMPAPEGCMDTALAAFAQLGALRLNSRRCLVTLMTTNVEFVLAESTRSMSLQYDMVEDPKDHTWIGTSSFLREDGINNSAIEEWRKAKHLREMPEDDGFYYKESRTPHWCIVSDLRECDEFRDKPFVQRGECIRFFFSVPLRDMQGSVIGSYTILDDKPRYGVSANEMAFMEDMADTVTEHLDATRVRAQRQRSERLIQGLGLFNNGKDSLREWWLTQEDARLRKVGRYQEEIEADPTARDKRADEEFGTQEQPGEARHPRSLISRHSAEDKKTTSVVARKNSAAVEGLRTQHIDSQDFDQRPTDETTTLSDFISTDVASNEADERQKKAKNRRSSTKHFDLARESEKSYSRASNLIRQALNTEGVVFLNTNVAASHPGRKWTSNVNPSSESEHTGSSWTTGPETRQLTASDSDTSDAGAASRQTCRVNGFSTRIRSSLVTPQSSTQRFGLTEQYLARLIKRYPQGKIFNFNEGGAPYSSSSEEHTTTGSSEEQSPMRNRKHKRPGRRLHGDARTLRNVLIGARTIAFYPLWDDTNERWRTCALVWSTTPLRFFDQTEDITYLAAFGHSLMAELSRLETIAADKAKSTFISSVSHELRSPLHGVLAGVEFLQEGELNPFQNEMVHTISMAGRTLLDTVNHILDFSKISSFTRAQRLDRVKADTARHDASMLGDLDELGVTSHVDLARLTEEVIETVIAAHRFQCLSHPSSGREPIEEDTRSTLQRRISHLEAEDQSPSITVYIAKRDNWVVELSPGSWTRIVTNLVGNALKYTKTGTISVRLDTNRTTTSSSKSGDSIPVLLVVEDTGIGISQAFLDNNLYTPFQQEDSHSSGTGLGLSIVKQICRELKANLQISSELGRGTRVALDFVATTMPAFSVARKSKPETQFFKAAHKVDLKRMHLLTLDDNGRTHPGSSLGLSVLETGHNWLGCEITSGPSMSMSSKLSICVITEADMLHLLDHRPDVISAMIEAFKIQHTRMLVLGSSIQSLPESLDYGEPSVDIMLVNQPIGPRKLLRAIVAGQDATTPRELNDLEDHVPYNIKPGQTSPSLAKRRSTTHGAPEARGSHFPWHKRPDSQKLSTQEKSENVCELGITSQMVASLPGRPAKVTRHDTDPMRSPAVLTPSVLDTPTSPLPIEADSGPLGPKTVLLVEDNGINMKLLMALMRKLHIPHITAINGLEALEAYSANPSIYFLILMDMSMPIMDGFTSTKRIREVEKKQKLVPCTIVALTGVSSEKARQDAFGAGVDRFFTKPISMKALKTLVQEVHIAREQ